MTSSKKTPDSEGGREDVQPPFSRDASGRLTYGKERVPRDDYPNVCKYLAVYFTLSPRGKPVEGFEEVFQEYEAGGAVVGLEWDHWSGFMAVAKNAKGEKLVRAIAERLEAKKK